MMDVNTSKSGATAVVTVTGDVDSETSPALALEVDRLVASGVTGISMDLAGVTFLSSAGLSVLIDARKQTASFHLLRGNHLVDRLVTLTGLEMLYGAEPHNAAPLAASPPSGEPGAVR